jgi:hypothetical protein
MPPYGAPDLPWLPVCDQWETTDVARTAVTPRGFTPNQAIETAEGKHEVSLLWVGPQKLEPADSQLTLEVAITGSPKWVKCVHFTAEGSGGITDELTLPNSPEEALGHLELDVELNATTLEGALLRAAPSQLLVVNPKQISVSAPTNIPLAPTLWQPPAGASEAGVSFSATLSPFGISGSLVESASWKRADGVRWSSSPLARFPADAACASGVVVPSMLGGEQSFEPVLSDLNAVLNREGVSLTYGRILATETPEAQPAETPKPWSDAVTSSGSFALFSAEGYYCLNYGPATAVSTAVPGFTQQLDASYGAKIQLKSADQQLDVSMDVGIVARWSPGNTEYSLGGTLEVAPEDPAGTLKQLGIMAPLQLSQSSAAQVTVRLTGTVKQQQFSGSIEVNELRQSCPSCNTVPETVWRASWGG